MSVVETKIVRGFTWEEWRIIRDSLEILVELTPDICEAWTIADVLERVDATVGGVFQ
jgi:hypothetical protein